MAIASLKDLYFDELGDLYDAETQMIRTLPRLAEAAHAPELREALVKHAEESRLHLERLELIFTHWGERRGIRPCAGLSGIVQEADDRLNQETTDDVRDASIIGSAQRIAHYEMAAYGCARTYARRLNRPDEARLLQETLDEEGRIDRRLSEMAEAHINDDARSEQDLREPAQAGRLRYVELVQAPRGRDGMEAIRVMNDQGEQVGSLDGLVVEGDMRQPRYVVVKGGGLLGRRRSLLPLDRIRFNNDTRVLLTDIPADLAERYPEFDHDEFHRMSDRDQRGYERSVLEFFRRNGPAAGAPAAGDVSIPEWLMTGAWVTLPPDRADRLSDEARSFANEFAPTSGSAEGENREPPRERMIAYDPQDLTPPHGDKLR